MYMTCILIPYLCLNPGLIDVNILQSKHYKKWHNWYITSNGNSESPHCTKSEKLVFEEKNYVNHHIQHPNLPYIIIVWVPHHWIYSMRKLTNHLWLVTNMRRKSLVNPACLTSLLVMQNCKFTGTSVKMCCCLWASWSSTFAKIVNSVHAVWIVVNHQELHLIVPKKSRPPPYTDSENSLAAPSWSRSRSQPHSSVHILIAQYV